MKSNEEFIAGIYEKAACYTEENETKVIRVNFAFQAAKIAAMLVVCIGLAGIGGRMLWNGNSGDSGIAPDENAGIALLSAEEEIGTGQGVAPAAYRMGPVAEWAEVTGVITMVDPSEQVFLIELEFTEDGPAETLENVLVAVKWDVQESMDVISVGNRIVVSGAAGIYENHKSEHSGTSMVILTDTANLWIWSEESTGFYNLNGERR